MSSDPLVQQFTARSEEALAEAKRRYGSGLRALSLRILGSPEDAEEVENDVYLEAWNRIPPAEPDSLKSFLYMICRRRSLDRLEARTAQKRGGGQAAQALEELEEVLRGEDGRDWAGQISLKEALERFLDSLPERERRIFLARYWYFLSAAEIAGREDLAAGSVRVILHRSRNRLKTILKKEELLE